MNVKELKSKERELRNEAASLESVFYRAVVKYLNNTVGVASYEADDKDGKVCLEEIYAYYNSDCDLVIIEYIIMDKHGHFNKFMTNEVSSSEIDKYILN